MYTATIHWGEMAEQTQTYSFKTEAEMNAFRLGIHEAHGWNDYEIADEQITEEK